MARMHALELLPDEAGRDVVRRDWQALRDAGLPSQLDHRGATNTPHLTLIAAPSLGPLEEQRAVELLGPLLPVEVRAAGIALLGGARVTLVRLVDVPDPLVRAVLDLRAAVTEPQHPGWLPHVTLARRVPRADVPRALDVLGHDDVVLSLSGLRRWDPDAGVVHPL
ncbi:2'-5' RNA ligase family protein [Nocardioides sp. SYSU D00065]|uniref:2'-5' RNA ligase family protein n=1 Tax=Nocardioides sp. SYSU D00065 TaxID=2817378 RepID=UPI001B325885|nr:2'-5' RNA ligase family protein [Nocardioides sp. SYSU D00065]